MSITDFFNAPVVNPSWKVTRTDIELVWFFRLWGLYDMVGEKKVDYVGWFDPTVPLSSKQDSWWGHAPDTDFLVYT